ncbi:ABC transporter permease [Flavobacterium sp. HSC-61S13]|uniref:ABC transporter permease n=1 Tax=Flavobacterium sp. HSC-61S13 TaxID=2910963 RepID=UPI0020A1585F|nr:ABC transporter permease [Flavobacterium sp. HSC-61S13]MCP1996899.1 putative ABC transport system permease protein [Flavobacterium sp. HSC-61S13]
MLLYLRLLNESFFFAINALRNNKLRTILSLLGVTVGIFSIIAVLSAVDSMDRKIKSDLSGIDRNMIYLFNHPFGPSDIPQWKINQFPKFTYNEYEYLRRNVADIDKISFNLFTSSENIKYGANTVNDISIEPGTAQIESLDNLKIAQGRFFNESESSSGAAVIVLGHEVAVNLFGTEDPIGKYVRLYGRRFTVLGVLEKEGMTSFGMSKDAKAFICSNFYRQVFGDNTLRATPAIVLKPKQGVDIEEFKDELTQKIRAYRGIKPSEDNNFFVNIIAGMLEMVDNIIGQMNIVGWIISGFSLLVGGFGIANIMFVSVKERTSLIGIQKSLGAKNRFILFQFLFEAVILSLFGGLIGMVLVWIIAMIVTQLLDFEFVLSFSNIVIGTGLAVFIGLLSGILPAVSASKLDPVEAIRTGN